MARKQLGATPSRPEDATTKAFVDAAVARVVTYGDEPEDPQQGQLWAFREKGRFVGGLNAYNQGWKAKSVVSLDGTTWDERTFVEDYATPKRITWIPEVQTFFMTAGNTNDVYTSPNGEEWTKQGSLFGDYLGQIAYSAELELFCGTCYSGAINTSLDGKTWTTSGTFGFGSAASLIWVPELSLFVAGTNTGAIRTSPDGTTWTQQYSNGVANPLVWELTWVPELELLVASMSNGDIVTSADAITWTVVGSIGADNFCTPIVWAAELELFVVSTYAGTILTSPDGATWTTRHTFGVGQARLAWAPELGLFVATSGGGSTSNGEMATSTDGINWTVDETYASPGFSAITWAVLPEPHVVALKVYTGTEWKLVTPTEAADMDAATSAQGALAETAVQPGDLATVATSGSYNDLTDTPATPPGSAYGQEAPGDPTTGTLWAKSEQVTSCTLVAASPYGPLATSSDGANWTQQDAFLGGGAVRAIAWSESLGIFVAVGDYHGSGRIATSPDGINWTEQSHSFGIAGVFVHAVAWSESLELFIAFDQYRNYSTSPDGITWTERISTNFGDDTSCAIWVDSLTLFVVTGTSGLIQTSPDAVNWTQQASSFDSTNVNDVAWSESLGIFVAVGDAGKLATSPDGINWTQRTSSFDANSIFGIAWSDSISLFVAVGDAGKLATSPDGMNWTQQTSSFDASIVYDVISLEPLGLFVAAGGDGKLATSPDGINWTQQTSGIGSDAIHPLAWMSTQEPPESAGLKVFDGTDWLPIQDPAAAQADDLATVAFTGSYNDLTDRPTIPDSPDDIDAATAAQGAKADAAIPNPATKATADVLTYDGSDWVAAAPAAGGIAGYSYSFLLMGA